MRSAVPKNLAFVLAAFFLGAFFCLTGLEAAQYENTDVSDNLLEGKLARDLEQFQATTSYSGGATTSVQFSHDQEDWYSASGTLSGWTVLEDDTGNYLDITALDGLWQGDWDGKDFYYKVKVASDDDKTAQLASSELIYTEIDIPTGGHYQRGSLISNIAEKEPSAAVLAFHATTTLSSPTTTAQVQFSQNRLNWYAADGTSGGWNSLSDGANTIDLTTLYSQFAGSRNDFHIGWNENRFYYRLFLESQDASSSPAVSEVGFDRHRYSAVATSSNLLESKLAQDFSAFHATTSEAATTTTRIQFSYDKENWYAADGTQGVTTLLADGGNVLDISNLYNDWNDWDGSHFYYRLVQTSDRADKTAQLKEYDFIYTEIDIPTRGKYQRGSLVSDNLLRAVNGRWSFDGQAIDWSGSYATAYDVTDNNQPARVVGAKSATGKRGQALEFDGTDDYLDIGTPTAGLRTIAFWLKAEDTTSRRIMALSESEYIGLDADSELDVPGYSSAQVYVDGEETAKVPDSSWHFVTVVLPGGVASRSTGVKTFYATTSLDTDLGSAQVQFSTNRLNWYAADGTSGGWTDLAPNGNSLDLSALDWNTERFQYRVRLQGSEATSSPALRAAGLQATSTFMLGRSGDNYFQGSLDEVQTYRQALSAKEAKALYREYSRISRPDAKVTGYVAPDLGGYWTFDGPDTGVPPVLRAEDKRSDWSRGSLAEVTATADHTLQLADSQPDVSFNSNLNADVNGNTVIAESLTAPAGGWYKVRYHTLFHSVNVSDRQIVKTWLERNGSVVTPSETRCYIRNDGSGDSNSNEATLFVQLNAGDTLDLLAAKAYGDSGTTELLDDCWLTVVPATQPIAQVYDASGGQNYDGTAITLNLDTETVVGSPYTHSGDTLEVSEDGWYRFYYTVNNHNDNQSDRQTVHSWLEKNGSSTVPASHSFSYIRNTSNGDQNHQSAIGLVYLTAGDSLEIRQEKYNQESSGSSVTLADRNWLALEQVASSNLFQAYNSTNNQSFGSSWEAVKFDTQDVKGAAYSHDAAGNTSVITVNEAGNYYIAYQFGWHDDGSSNRFRVHTAVYVNGSKLDPSRQTGYTRGHSVGRRDTNTGYVYASLSAGDTVELYTTANQSSYDAVAEAAGISIVPSGYPPSGSRTSPRLDLSPARTAGDSEISWSADIPASTSVAVETNLSLDSGASWQGWQTATSGQSIPGLEQGTDLSEAYLDVRQILSSQDPQKTPVLDSLELGVSIDCPGDSVLDQSGYGYTGCLRSGADTAIGRSGQAIRLDGTSGYADVGSSTSGVNTVAFWMRADDTTSRPVLDLNGTAYVELDSGANLNAPGFTSPAYYVDGQETASVPDTSWHYVVITSDSGLVATDLDIGRRESSGYFAGKLDEVRLYQDRLASDRAEKLYDRNAGSVEVNASVTERKTQGVVGHWTFNGPAMRMGAAEEVRDQSGQGYHGSLTGNAITAIGKTGQGIEFDGNNSYVNIGSGPSGVNAIAFWLKAEDRNAAEILQLQSASHYLELTNEKLNAVDLTSPEIYIDGRQTDYLPDANWHHITVTTPSGVDATDLRLGAGPSGSLAGKLDEVRFYDKELTKQEIEKLARVTGRITRVRPRPPQNFEQETICEQETVTDIEGNTYGTVAIGDKCWLSKNMRTTTYPDGTAINKGPSSNGADGWETDQGYYSCPPNTANDGEDCSAADSLGMLYQWSAAMHGSIVAGAQGICPNGWHVPTDAELAELEKELHEASCDPDRDGAWACDAAGSKLGGNDAAAEDWAADNLSSHEDFDSSGFNAAPTGNRQPNGDYNSRAYYIHFWSSSETASGAWARDLEFTHTGTYRYDYTKPHGYSVRCVADD